MSIQGEEKTEIVYGIDNILLQTFDRWNLTKFTIDSYLDKLHPIMLLTIEPIKQGVVRLINNGIKIRTITEITEENIFHVKELIKMVKDKNAFRHLDNVTGNFSISDRKIYQAQIMGDLSAPSVYTDSINETNGKILAGQNKHVQNKQHASAPPLSPITEKLEINNTRTTKTTAEPQSIRSNIKAFVDHQQYIFEMMWDKAIPARQKIMEIEHEIKYEFTKSIQDPNEILKSIFSVLQSASGELQILFSSIGTFQKMQNMGITEIIKERALIHGIDTKILVNIEKESESKTIKKEQCQKETMV